MGGVRGGGFRRPPRFRFVPVAVSGCSISFEKTTAQVRGVFTLLGSCLMLAFTNRVQRFLTSEDGPTAVEYAVMLALIIVACIGIVTTLGTSVSSTFSATNSGLTGS
jgi:pilus assembly protein Flp/PilA